MPRSGGRAAQYVVRLRTPVPNLLAMQSLNSSRTRSKDQPVKLLRLPGIIWASPNTLLGLTIGGLGMCFGSRVQVTDRAIEFYDGGVKWLLCKFPNGQFIFAMTLGHVVIGQSPAALDISRTHETVHVKQYERWGPFFLPAYVLSSLYVWCRGRRLYRDNPFEVEAYNVDDMSRGNTSGDDTNGDHLKDQP